MSVASGGAAANADAEYPVISADGRWIAYCSNASNLVAGDGNGFRDVFVFDMVGRTTQRVSVSSSGAEGNDFSHHPAISADGRWIAFNSSASNLVGGDGNGTADVFLARMW